LLAKYDLIDDRLDLSSWVSLMPTWWQFAINLFTGSVH